MSDIRVTPADMRALGYCSRGSHALAQRYNLDWMLFLREGIPVAEMECIDDDMVRAAVEHARKRTQGE